MSAQEKEPTGTVRREPVHGALAVCITGGYRVMDPKNAQVMVLSHSDAQNLGVRDWPIIWCPNAAYHEQDNIRRAQGRSSTSYGRAASGRAGVFRETAASDQHRTPAG